MANAQVFQSAFELLAVPNPNGRVYQSAFEIVAIGIPDPPSAPANPQHTVGGIPASLRQCGPHPTPYDLCLDAEALRIRRITFPDICAIPKALRNSTPWDEQEALPKQARPLYISNGIVTPAPAAGDQVVLSFRTDQGYDTLLTSFFFGYSGQGFQQGSGDILFRIKQNQYFLKNLGNVAYVVGSTRYPCPMTEGRIVFPSTVIQVLVNVPNLSGLIQVGASTIFAGVFGFAWPRGEARRG